MGVFKTIKEKIKTALVGKLITDLGVLPTDSHGRQLSLSIRQRPGQQPYLRLKWEGCGETDYGQIVCSEEWASQWEQVAREMRRHTSKQAT